MTASRGWATSRASPPRRSARTGICMHLLTMPAGARAKAHMHENHETAIYVLSGVVHTWSATGWRTMSWSRRVTCSTSRPACRTCPPTWSSEPASAVISRTDPNEQESVVLLPQLDGLVTA